MHLSKRNLSKAEEKQARQIKIDFSYPAPEPSSFEVIVALTAPIRTRGPKQIQKR
jgi:hypothetical protein